MKNSKTKIPRRIASAITKGGEGKTTTVTTLAVELANRGRKVLLVDGDPQAQVRFALQANPFYTLFDLADGVPFEDVVHRFPNRPNLDVVCSSGNLASLATAWTITDIDRELQLTEILEQVEVNYDYVLLDTAPMQGIINTNILYYANEIIVPVSLRAMGFDGFQTYIGHVKKIIESKKRRGSVLNFGYLLPTQMDRRKRGQRNILEQIKKFVEDEIPEIKFCTPIPTSSLIEEAPAFGETIIEFAPNNSGATAYKNFVDEVINNESKKQKTNSRS